MAKRINNQQRMSSNIHDELSEQIRHARAINDLLYILHLEQQDGESVCLHDETRIEALAMLDSYLTNAQDLLQRATHA